MKKLFAKFSSTLAVFSLLAFGSTHTLAAEGQIVIEDLTPANLRNEIKKIEAEFYRVFNESVENKKLTIVCYNFTPTGSNIKRETCEPQFVVDRRADNSKDSRFGLDVLYSADSLRSELAPQFAELTAAMTELAEENEYFRELDSILAALRDELASR
ncbi:MAG: hypothetical protein WDZ52_09515 [Pseudohongiellaceae bacterium]